MRTPSRIYHVIQDDQRGAFLVLRGIEGQKIARAFGARSRISRLYLDWAAE